MFHHRPLQHCLFTMVCVLLSLPPAFWTAWVPPTHTYPTGRLDPQRGTTRFGETSCHVHRGVVWKLEFAISCAAPPRGLAFGALGLSVLGVWGDGYPLGGGARKTWCLIQIYLVIGDVGKVVLTWVGAFFHGLLKKSAWICSNNSDWWSIQVYFMGGSTQSIRTHHTSSRQLSSP